MKTLVLLFGFASKAMSLPLFFEPNVGQSHPSVQFLSRGAYLGSDRAAIQVGDDGPVVMTLAGARAVRAEGLDLQPGITSYFLGNDPGKWRSGVPHYARVRYRNVYPGIDLIYYHNAKGRLEYDFVVSPGADTGAIQLSYNRPVRTDSNGDLLIAGVRQKRPRVFQDGREIACDYLLRGAKQVRFALAKYDRSRPLIVDPVLEYSTYLGGPGYDYGQGIAVDASGSAYITGLSRAPTQPGLDPFQQPEGLNYNAFVIKMAPGGSGLIYYVFIGDQFEDGNAIAIDSTGAAVITGETRSLNFPTKNPFQATYGGGFNDGFVSKVSPDGLSLVFSSYIGGPSYDLGTGVAVDPTGSAYVSMQTARSSLPTNSDAFQRTLSGNGYHLYVFKLSPAGSITWGTYLASSGNEIGLTGIAVDSTGHVFLAGCTDSADFPTTENAFQPTFPATAADVQIAFVSKLEPDGTGLVYSTFLGGTSGSGAEWVAVDASGSAYVGGTVEGQDFPIKNAIQTNYGGGINDGFVAELTPGGDALVFSTFLGGSGDEYNCCSVALGPNGAIYVGGHTTSQDFPVKNSIQPFRAAGTLLSGQGIFAQFNPGGSLVLSSFLGGSTDTWVAGIASDASGAIYLTGQTSDSDFPLMNPFQKTNGGLTDIFITKVKPDTLPPSPFSATPIVLPAQFVIGGAAPASETITVNSSPPGQAFTATVDAKWLSVSSSSLVAPATLTVSIDTSGLAPGPYTGTVHIDAQTAVAVNLLVFNPAPVVTSVAPAAIAPDSNDTTVTITGSGFVSGAVLEFANLLSPFPTTFVNSSTLTAVVAKSWTTMPASFLLVVVNPQSLPSQTFSLTIGILSPQVQAVTNAASFAAGIVAPGEIATIFGGNLTASSGIQLVSSVPLPKTFLDVSVMVNGSAAPLFAVDNVNGQQQINFQVPWEVVSGSTAGIVVTGNGTSSAPLRVPVSVAQPGIFAYNASGQSFGAILHANFQLADAAHPVKGGETVLIYCTGLGAVSSPPGDGAAGNGQATKAAASVTIGGVNAAVSFSGLAPGFVGLYQVNAGVPTGLASGNQPVVLLIGGASSNSVLLPVS
jgi:uncharacterized protein (TIGR03437 family)